MIRWSLFLLLALTTFGVVYVARHVPGKAEQWLAVAQVLVGAATFASIAFAAFTYFEATIIVQRVAKARSDIVEVSQSSVKQMRDLREEYEDKYYKLAVASVKAQLGALLANPSLDPDLLRSLTADTKRLEMQIHLRHSSSESLQAAIQIAYKDLQDDFLDLEDTIWSGSEDLPKQERDVVRSSFRTLRNNIFARNLGRVQE